MATGPCRAKDYATTRYSPLAEITRAECQPAASGVDVLDRRTRAATRGSRSWSATPCTWSRPGPTCSMRSISARRAIRCAGSTGRTSVRMRSVRPAAIRQSRRVARRRQTLSTTCSTVTRWQSMPRAGGSCGTRRIAISAAARPSPWRRSSSKDRVIVGASGGEFGIYGWVKGLDLKTPASSSGPRTTWVRIPTCS